MADLKKEVESLLFASGRVMTEKDLADVIGVRVKEIQKALEALKTDYESRDTSLTLMQNGQEWKLNVKEQYVSLVTKIVADTELPFPMLETLSVIAYKAPALQAEVIQTRGTNAYEHIQALIDAGFVDRRKKGRSFELVLTQKFFEYFDVPGEQKLKMMFKDVKPSEPKKKKASAIEVVDVPEGQQAAAPSPEAGVWSPKPAGQVQDPNAPVQKIGELDVVAIPERKKVEPFKPDNNFLDDIDSRIGQLSKKNDDNDQDELFKKTDGLEEVDSSAETESIGQKKANEIFGDAPKEESSEDGDDDSEVEKIKSKDPLADDEDKLEI